MIDCGAEEKNNSIGDHWNTFRTDSGRETERWQKKKKKLTKTRLDQNKNYTHGAHTRTHAYVVIIET